MAWTTQIYQYCERGADASLLAEPVNAFTNIAFFLAAAFGYKRLRTKRRIERSADDYLLVGLVGLIGLGSLLFHTFAQRWSALADVGPIMVFIFVYLAFALVNYLKVPPGVSLILVGLFGAASWLIMQIRCGTGWFDVSFGGEGGRCLNGSLGYVPALAALGFFAWKMWNERHPAAPLMGLAAGLFLVSITFRSLDQALCGTMNISGYALGTHFLWHALNGTVLYVLVRAAIDHGQYGRTIQEILPPPHRKAE